MPDERQKSLTISISSGDRKQVIERPTLNIKVAGQEVRPKRQGALDLVFVIDTTGSMSDKIEGLLLTCQHFVDECAALHLDLRMAIVAFGDLTVPGDKISVVNFTQAVEAIKRALRKIPRYSGGGNEGESSLEALEHAISLSFRPGAVKAVVLITDEPALQHNVSVSTLSRKLVDAEVLTFVVSPAISYYQEMSTRTGAAWYQIGTHVDLSGVIAMFKGLASDLSDVVSNIYKIGNGSVKTYLRLKSSP